MKMLLMTGIARIQPLKIMTENERDIKMKEIKKTVKRVLTVPLMERADPHLNWYYVTGRSRDLLLEIRDLLTICRGHKNNSTS